MGLEKVRYSFSLPREGSLACGDGQCVLKDPYLHLRRMHTRDGGLTDADVAMHELALEFSNSDSCAAVVMAVVIGSTGADLEPVSEKLCADEATPATWNSGDSSRRPVCVTKPSLRMVVTIPN